MPKYKLNLSVLPDHPGVDPWEDEISSEIFERSYEITAGEKERVTIKGIPNFRVTGIEKNLKEDYVLIWGVGTSFAKTEEDFNKDIQKYREVVFAELR